ncbi:MAG TPA: hypothetical protein VG734_27335 [Lacunisphaera sp.]|nr:hypothetical protein [Lacunisphaera sp.]
MGQETITYLTNIVIGVILAGLLTHYWYRQGRSATARYWMLAAWIMTMADLLFALRPILPYEVSRLMPTLLVTVGHCALCLGAQRTAGLQPHWKGLGAALFLHAAGLAVVLVWTEFASWRMVMNGVVWAGLSFWALHCLRSAPAVFWQSPVSPANAFLVHGVFHVLRVGMAAIFALRGTEPSPTLQIVGDLEVSFFMVALFVAILIATLQMRHDELSSAHAEVQALTGLLPICAWCKKVRDDDGYWRQVEVYFAHRDHIQFTHGICTDCLDAQKAARKPASHPQGPAAGAGGSA